MSGNCFVLIDSRVNYIGRPGRLAEALSRPERITIGVNILDRCNLSGFRIYLLATFGVPKKSRITYMDDDGDILPIDSETEFVEALQVVKMPIFSATPLFVACILYNKQNLGHVIPLKKDFVPLNKDFEHISDNVATSPFTVPSTVIVKDPLTLEKIRNLKKIVKSMMLTDEQCTEQSKEQCSTSTEKINDCICTQKAGEKIIIEMREALEKFRNTHVLTTQRTDTLPPSPPSWFTHYMESMKKDIISTITREVTENLTKTLNEQLDSFKLSMFDEIDKLLSMRSQSYFSKQYSRYPNLHSNENNQKRKKTEDDKQYNVALTKWLARTKQEKANIIKDVTKRKLHHTLHYDLAQQTEDMLHLEEKLYNCVTEVTNHFDKDTNKEQEQSVQINTREECVSQKILPTQIENNLHKEEAFQSQKIFDSDLRMNCSITGHQILDKDRCKDRRYCSISDIDSISCCSNNSNVMNDQEEDSFEVIQIPNMTNIEHSEEPAGAEKENNSSRGSPSFELVSETPSSPFSMCEDHFSINEGDLQPSEKTDLSRNIPSVANIDNEICNKDLSTDPDKHINIDLEKPVELEETILSNMYSVISPRFLNDINISPAYPLYVKEQSKEQKNTHVNHPDMCKLNKQKDSKGTQYPEEPASYPKMHSQCSYQSQTDSVDSILSFHSHTTSVTDDPYADAYSSIQYTELHNCDEEETKIINSDNLKKKMKVDEQRHQDPPKGRFASVRSNQCSTVPLNMNS